jgi:uncharacterized protein YxjI
MRQKFWTFGDRFLIKDESGNDVYQIVGKFFALADSLSFQDMHGRESAHIIQKLISFKRRYQVCRDGKPVADVVKEITLFKDKYTVDIPGPNDYSVQGNFWDHEYHFLRGGNEAAHVSKKLFNLTDTYGIEVADNEDDVLILATAVVIDLVNHAEHDRN